MFIVLSICNLLLSISCDGMAFLDSVILLPSLQLCSKLTIETLEQRCRCVSIETQEHHERRSGVFIVNFGHISDFNIVFLLLTLNMGLSAGCVLYVV